MRGPGELQHAAGTAALSNGTLDTLFRTLGTCGRKSEDMSTQLPSLVPFPVHLLKATGALGAKRPDTSLALDSDHFLTVPPQGRPQVPEASSRTDS